jgi:multidrug/hemolysin transport system permease protein
VLFSLMAVFIIIGLYALFLGDVWMDDLPGEGGRFLIDSWLIGGLLAVTSVTTTLGAFGIMVEDRAKKIAKDFYAAPIKRRDITLGYIFSVVIIGFIMSLVALVLSEAYILLNGGELLGAVEMLKVLGVILLATLSSTAMMGWIVSFFKSQNGFTAVSTIVGTLVGFVAGIYLPIGQLPEAVQTIVKVFPVSHAAALMRQIMMQSPAAALFAGAPAETVSSFNEMMGVSFKLGGLTVTPLMSILFLAATAALFYSLAIINMARKKAI